MTEFLGPDVPASATAYVTRIAAPIPVQLEALTREQSAALHAYRGLIKDTDRPIAQLVLAMLIRETQHDRALLPAVIGRV